jgi:hypothetical protein
MREWGPWHPWLYVNFVWFLWSKNSVFHSWVSSLFLFVLWCAAPRSEVWCVLPRPVLASWWALCWFSAARQWPPVSALFVSFSLCSTSSALSGPLWFLSLSRLRSLRWFVLQFFFVLRSCASASTVGLLGFSVEFFWSHCWISVSNVWLGISSPNFCFPRWLQTAS